MFDHHKTFPNHAQGLESEAVQAYMTHLKVGVFMKLASRSCVNCLGGNQGGTNFARLLSLSWNLLKFPFQGKNRFFNLILYVREELRDEEKLYNPMSISNLSRYPIKVVTK